MFPIIHHLSEILNSDEEVLVYSEIESINVFSQERNHEYWQN